MQQKLRKEPNCTINPDEAVAAGAAIVRVRAATHGAACRGWSR